MKLQIAFDIPNLSRALKIAALVVPHADIVEIGTLLLFVHGITAIQAFREMFPDATIFVDAKIIDRGKLAVDTLSHAGANWISVMAGTSKHVIHAACSAAHERGVKIMLDLLDADIVGPSVMDAKNLGAHALLLHEPYDKAETSRLFEKWEMVKENTNMPIFISAKITRESIASILALNPNGVVIGHGITEAEDPATEARYFKELIKNYHQ